MLMGPKVIIGILRPSSAQISERAYITCPMILPPFSITKFSSGTKAGSFRKVCRM